MKSRTIDLETFLEGLPTTAAANARAAAARIDELEHAAQRIGKSDRQYTIAFGVAGFLMLVATYLTLGGYEFSRGGGIAWGDWAVLVMASALPVLIFVYSIRMFERTKLDQKKFEIIETYFMPFDGIYFPPEPGRETGIISMKPEGSWREANQSEVKKARMYW